MDSLDDAGSRQHQQVVGAAQVRRVVEEAVAPECSLVQLVGLDHGAHGTVEDEDPLPEQVGEQVGALDALRVGVQGSGSSNDECSPASAADSRRRSQASPAIGSVSTTVGTAANETRHRRHRGRPAKRGIGGSIRRVSISVGTTANVNRLGGQTVHRGEHTANEVAGSAVDGSPSPPPGIVRSLDGPPAWADVAEPAACHGSAVTENQRRTS